MEKRGEKPLFLIKAKMPSKTNRLMAAIIITREKGKSPPAFKAPQARIGHKPFLNSAH